MSHGVLDGSTARLRPQWADAHPWLISATVIVSLGTHNMRWVTLIDVLIILGFALLAVTLGFVGLLLVRRCARHAALVASWLSLLGFYYGALFEGLGNLPAGESAALRHGLLLTIGLGMAAILWWHAGELKPFSSFVSLTAAIVLTAYSLIFGLALSQLPRSHWSDLAKAYPLPAEVASPDEGHPDIYYLILDGYGRGDVLQKYYGFDNSEFLDGLRQRGFYVADKSSTNYPGTAFSLSSSLNMRYHEPLDQRRGLKPLAEMVRSHEVGLRLREQGYKLVHFNTRFIVSACSDISHVSLGEQTPLPPGSRMMMLALIRHSVLRFVNGGERGFHAAQHRRALTELADVPVLPGPKFTFCHLVAPHPPFVFDREGRTDWGIDQNNRASYIDQVVFINRAVTRAIDAILANSPVPPIIIVQADHGPGFCPAKPDSTDPDADFVQERIPILNAYLVPEAMRQKLYPTITPVNTFRLLLTECFGLDYPPVPDRNFLFHRENWMTYEEVTARVHEGTPEWGLQKPTLVPPTDHAP